MDTRDLDSYYAGYDDYCDTSKPIYSQDDFYELKNEHEEEIKEKIEEIEDLVDKFFDIKDRLNEIKDKISKEDFEYLDKIIREVIQ